MNLTGLIREMITYDAGDAKRIQHFLKVHTLAALIGREEKLPSETQDILEAAAILHDIGIHEAERKYGSTSGKYQELEGVPLARTMLEKLGFEVGFIERVCYLVGHHHTYNQVDGQDYQILLEADFLVNAYEDQLSTKAIASFRDKIFRTDSGKKLLEDMYGACQ